MIGRRSHDDDASSFDEAWNGRAPRDAQVAELVRTAEMLCEAAVVEPSPAFRDALRAELMTEAASVLKPAPGSSRPARPTTAAPPPSRARRRLAGLTAAALASAGIVGMVSTAASAVPGEMLYPVKRGVESVELALHRSDVSRGEFRLAQASERLAEARHLTDAGSTDADLVSSSLDDFVEQAEAGSTALFSEFTSNGSTATVETVNDFAAAATADLSTLSALLPEGSTTSFDSAAEAVRSVATQASSLCGTCSDVDTSALVAAVGALAPSPSTPGKESDGSSAGDTDEAQASAPSKPSATTRPTATAAAPSPSAPAAPATPAPTKTTPSSPLAPLTDPLVGALLGDDEQVGLVPGLLGGLLGGGKK